MLFRSKITGQTFDVPHTSRARWCPDTYAPTNFTGSSELTTAAYALVSSQDGVTNPYSQTMNGIYSQQLFSFDLLNDLKNTGKIPKTWGVTELKAAMRKLSFTWVGYGVGSNGGASANGAVVKAWGNNGVQWFGPLMSGTETVATSRTWSSGTLSEASFYIDPNGLVHILAHSTHPSDGTIAAAIYTDYVKLDVQFVGEYMLGEMARAWDHENRAIRTVATIGGNTKETIAFSRFVRTATVSVSIVAPAGAKGGVFGVRVHGVTGTFAAGQGMTLAVYDKGCYDSTPQFGATTDVQSGSGEHTVYFYPGAVRADGIPSSSARSIKVVGAPIPNSVVVILSITGTFDVGQGFDCEAKVRWLY